MKNIEAVVLGGGGRNLGFLFVFTFFDFARFLTFKTIKLSISFFILFRFSRRNTGVKVTDYVITITAGHQVDF